jgi:hypothetical protein
MHPVKIDLVWTSLANYYKNWVMNPFVKGIVFETLLTKARRCNFALRRFFLRRLKKKQCVNKDDLSMTPFSDVSNSLTLILRQAGKNYKFNIVDLLKLVHQGLTANIEMHPTPKHVHHPYTRSPLHPNTLYLLFVKVCESNLIIPPLFLNFARCNFNLNRFFILNEATLRHHAIKNTVESMPLPVLHEEIEEMLLEIRMCKPGASPYETVIPNPRLIPRSELTQFKPWLHGYYIFLHSFNPSCRENTYKILVRDMIEFKKKNPKFGTKVNHIIQTDVTFPVRRYQMIHL